MQKTNTGPTSTEFEWLPKGPGRIEKLQIIPSWHENQSTNHITPTHTVITPPTNSLTHSVETKLELCFSLLQFYRSTRHDSSAQGWFSFRVFSLSLNGNCSPSVDWGVSLNCLKKAGVEASWEWSNESWAGMSPCNPDNPNPCFQVLLWSLRVDKHNLHFIQVWIMNAIALTVLDLEQMGSELHAFDSPPIVWFGG